MLSAAVLASAWAPAQGGEPGGRLFAWPWEIDFARVQAAMSGLDYQVDQVRRVLDRHDPRVPNPEWVAVRERLVHAAGSREPERFWLSLVGLEHRDLDPEDLALRAKQFQDQSFELVHNHSFRVHDADRAAACYRIVFLGMGARVQRTTYQVAVLSKVGRRSAWLLDLDVASGYPLYQGEYTPDGELVAEIEVTRISFAAPSAPETLGPPVPGNRSAASGARPPVGTDPGSPLDVLAAAGVPAKSLPASSVLPHGYALVSFDLRSNPYNGVPTARLIYSDGLDQLFLGFSADSRSSLGAGTVVELYQDAGGLAQCRFVHQQVQYLVVGRGIDMLRQVAQALYAQVLP